MIVITRNGKTQVYTGWRAWLLLGVVLLAAWLVFALIAFVVAGAVLTAGIMLLLLVPAIIVTTALAAMMRR